MDIYQLLGDGGTVVDTVHVSESGAVQYSTGQARPLVEAALAACARRGVQADLDGHAGDAGTLAWVPTWVAAPHLVTDIREAVAASGAKFERYWTKGKGAAVINWGADGDFDRCVTALGSKVDDPKGLCAEYHKTATGKWPNEK